MYIVTYNIKVNTQTESVEKTTKVTYFSSEYTLVNCHDIYL